MPQFIKEILDSITKIGIYVLFIIGIIWLSTWLGPSEEEKTERQIKKAMYEKEIYDEGYNQAKWEYEAELERAKFEIDYAYEVGFERGYEACLEEYGLNG